MFTEAEDDVRDFQLKYGIPTGLAMSSIKDKMAPDLLAKMIVNTEQLTQLLWLLSDSCSAEDKVVIHRICIMAEEFVEMIAAMARGDELGTLDGVADLIYTVIGTAVTFSLPLSLAFEEVHRSNMTKTLRVGNSKEAMKLEKGPDYTPPDLLGVINSGAHDFQEGKGLLRCENCGGRVNEECFLE